MATTTPNFGWSVPTSTDLVKDGATAIELLGDSIDASLVDLKGGTTGQVLSKASATDMDFSWVAQDDSNAIQNAIVDAKGDLISATAADTPSRLAVGANGTVLTADSTTATGLKWATASGASALVLINTNTFSASTSIDFSDVFSTTYDNYLIMGTFTANTGSDLNFRFRVGGADNSTSNYNFQVFEADGATLTGGRGANQTNGRFVATGSGRSSFTTTMFSPFLSQTKHYVGQGECLTTSSNRISNISGSFNDTTSFTGMTVIPGSGSVTGTIRVYGIANA